ncbi:MFS transporter [Pseudoxanthomonas dokdonensis]|uniref:Major facilitator transporter n=1 Tax=Pseudoxanthomonas dokdonensis TaxID=344882 RepID=A0A0R0CMC6_9GAMM|nr:MFS transporter [Pseudoxanthomonas dokdonensis]KRG71196.1 major facilitator transporter [Pseudoxanthomonas dokdonensis]
MSQKPHLSFWQIWNMSFGFLGIQFGFALQGGFMSRIFQTLGADKDSLPLLWIAAPLTGLLVQPVIGYLSDRTWHPWLGRRRPYFLIGAVLSSIALFFVPYSPTLWVAVGFLWILDASINISMEPFRALVADKLSEQQRSYGFVLQTLIIGIGTWVASNLPWLVNQLGVSNQAAPGVVPPSVKLAFAIGAAVFLVSILVTVVTTREDPPAVWPEPVDTSEKASLPAEILHNIVHMPRQMLNLGFVQFFSWLAFFSMWSLSTPALTEHVFKAPAPDPAAFDVTVPAQAQAFALANGAYQSAADLVGSYTGYYGLSSMLVALLLSLYASRHVINRRRVHFVSLMLGGIGFLSMMWVPEPAWLIGSFALVGVAWASILSMPYALLSSSVDPRKMGISMGIFNMFIVIPQIVASTLLGPALRLLFDNQSIYALVISGLSLVLAALLLVRVEEPKAQVHA